MSDRDGAWVETLTAEVRCLMVGKRQVTLSVYRQLDEVEPDQCQPFGRVRDRQGTSVHHQSTHVVGKHTETGALVKSSVEQPDTTPTYVIRKGEGRLIRDWWRESDEFNSFEGEKHNYAVIKQDQSTGIAVRVHLARDYCYEAGRRPSGWTYASAEHRKAMQEWAYTKLSVQRAAWAWHDQWSALPLIVLAGLK